MKLLIIILKMISILAFGWRVYMLYRLKQADSSAKQEYELFSRLEVGATYGVALIGVLAVLNETTYVFTAILNLLGAVLMITSNLRIIVGGNKCILLKMKIYELRKIKGMRTGRFTLNVFTKDGETIRIWAPLTINTTVAKMKYLK